MLKGYGHIVDFFRAFEWWKTVPRNDLVESGSALVLAELGRQCAVCLPNGGSVALKLVPGRYAVR